MSVSKEAVEAAARAMFAKGRKGDDVPSWEAATDEMKAWISGIAEAALTAALPFLARPAPSQIDEDSCARISFDCGLCSYSASRTTKELDALAAVRAEATLAGAAAEREAIAMWISPLKGDGEG